MLSSLDILAEIELPSILAKELEAATTFHVLTLCIFILAVIHTLMSHHFTRLSGKVERRHARKLKGKERIKRVSFLAEILKFFGEIEIVFILWVIPLMIVVMAFYGFDDVLEYLNTRVYTEPLFIFVIMSLASSRPIIKLAEKGFHLIAQFFGDRRSVYWLAILTIGPVIGSFITEAAAMTIAALLMQRKIYIYEPTKRLAYSTLALMFVHFSVAGVLTNFAAPPALALSRCWGLNLGNFWNIFGWRVLLGIVIVNALSYLWLRKDFKQLNKSDLKLEAKLDKDISEGSVPLWVSLIHMVFIAFVIAMAHYPPLFLGSYLLFLGFHQATRHHQFTLNLKRPMFVGVFLAGLVIHGGLQGWWIEPLLGDMGYAGLMFTGTVLTAFNENTTVAYLVCFLEDLTPALKYAITCGLVAGGGLTIIAHAPNPVGQALLGKYFKGGVSPWNLFLSALVPTLIFLAIFYFFPSKALNL